MRMRRTVDPGPVQPAVWQQVRPEDHRDDHQHPVRDCGERPDRDEQIEHLVYREEDPEAGQGVARVLKIDLQRPGQDVRDRKLRGRRAERPEVLRQDRQIRRLDGDQDGPDDHRHQDEMDSSLLLDGAVPPQLFQVHISAVSRRL